MPWQIRRIVGELCGPTRSADRPGRGGVARPPLQRSSAAEVLHHLEKARSLVSRPGSWTQSAYARNKRGLPVDSDDCTATSYCLSGAIYAVQDGEAPWVTVDVRTVLYRTIMDDMETWNDASERRHADVIAAFDRAIQSLRPLAERQARETPGIAPRPNARGVRAG